MYTIKIIRFIGEHRSEISWQTDAQTANMLLNCDVIKYKDFRIKIDYREIIANKRMIRFIGKEWLYEDER